MIEFQNVTLTRRSRKLLDSFSFRLADPGVFVLIGGNGSGKSLFSNLLAGKCKPDSGQILVEGSGLYGIGADRYLEPIFHANAGQGFPFDETLDEYISAELQLAGGDLGLAGQCLDSLENHVPGGANAKMSGLPHSLVLLAQIALAAVVPCRVVVLDGHLTFLDNKHCLVAANLACDSLQAGEKYFIFTSGRLAQRLPGITQYYLLGNNLPLEILPLDGQQAKQTQAPREMLSVYFAGEWDAAKGIVSGNHFKLVSKLDNGLRIKLTGTLDGMLEEFAAAGLTLRSIDWD